MTAMKQPDRSNPLAARVVSPLRRSFIYSLVAHVLFLILVSGIARPSFSPKPREKKPPVVMVTLASLPKPEPGTTVRVKPHAAAPTKAPEPAIAKPKPDSPKPSETKPKLAETKKPPVETKKPPIHKPDDKTPTHDRYAPDNAPDVMAKAGSADTTKVEKSDLPHVGTATTNVSIKVDGPLDPFSYYLTAVQQKLSRAWDPPVDAIARQGEVTASMRFRIIRSGAVPQESIAVEEPSGSYLFDQSMLQALATAGSLPPLPPEYPEESLGLEITFIYHQ